MIRMLILLVFLTCRHGISQDFEAVDIKVLQYPAFVSPDALAYRIRNDFDSDTERVRAAFIWVSHNITYVHPYDDIFLTRFRVSDGSESNKQARNVRFGNRMERAFELRKGVCMDYSLLLNALCLRFGLPARVITGLGKTDIRDIGGERLYKNHTWNAVRIYGEWKLMDPTWASGYLDPVTKQFTPFYTDHYFFTEPSDFVKHHLPANPEWQLLEVPLNTREFFDAPIFFPEFFDKGIELSPRTSGTLKLSDRDGQYLFFKKLPEQHAMHYTINGTSRPKRMGFKKGRNQSYVSRLRLRQRLRQRYDYLTVFLGESPILNFRIEE